MAESSDSIMSAMSASPVKPPVLPPSGVNVTPPVATSPPKVGMMPIPSTLTIAPTKPANMNHTAMPLSLIADHKMAPQFPTQSQTGVPPAMQPIPQSLPRPLEKPKELSAPIGLSVKPTSNGMEGLPLPNQPLPSSTPALPEAQVSAAPPFKADHQPITEMPDGKPTLPENASETPVATTAPPIENATEKKEDVAILKPVEPAAEPAKPVPAPIPQPQDNTPTVTTCSTPALVSVPAPTPTAGPVPPPTVAPAAPTTATPQPTPPTEQQSVTPSVSRTETSIPHSKPELKVATIPRQAAKRKREPKVSPPSPEVKKEGKDDDRKSKRVRLPTQPYQSPLPELNIIAKINKSTKSTPSKAADDKLIVFYKNEFLAVRNAEGGFYVCQAMQNIYKSSPRIRIRWLSQEGGKDTYSPDFYDHTDFDCILTNLNLDKVEKEKFRLPLVEQQRTESILKRALDVEKGVSEKPPVTEEHPDGLDLSLFRDESQLKKSKSRSRNSSTGKKSDSVKSDDAESSEEEDEEEGGDDGEEDEKDKKTKKESPLKTSKKKKKSVKKKPPAEKKSAAKSSSNKSTVQPAKKKNDSRVGSKRKSPVSSNSQPVEKRSRTSSQPSDRSNKTRSVEATAGVKSQRDRRAKSRK